MLPLPVELLELLELPPLLLALPLVLPPIPPVLPPPVVAPLVDALPLVLPLPVEPPALPDGPRATRRSKEQAVRLAVMITVKKKEPCGAPLSHCPEPP